MIITFVGAVVLAIALCGTVAGIYRLLGRPIPRGVLPLVGGIGMFGFMAWNENSWYTRQLEDLPDTVVVFRTGEFSNFIQPWTMIWPRVNRYMAIDRNNIIANDFDPNLKLTEIIVAERYTPTRIVNQFVDCANRRAASRTDTVALDDQGIPTNANWFDLTDEDKALLDAVCSG